MRIKPKEVRHSKERLSCSASKSHTATVGSSASPLDVTGRKRTQKKKGVGKAQRRQRNKNISEERAVKILELVGTNGLSASMSQVETKQVILKLLGDKSSVPVRCCDEDASLLQDMDLMILGSPPEEYRRYAKLLREEYACMSDAEYKQMRLKVLETLLRIPYIFATCEFQAKYEEPARANIKQEIEELKQ